MNKQEQADLVEWLKLHDECAVCWWPRGDGRREVEVHHICGGASRSKGHDARNFLLLCERCHGIHHSGKIYGLSPDLTKAMILFAKRESDPGLYDPAYLAALRNKRHLGYDPEPIPEYYLRERERNRGPWDKRRPWPQ